MLDTLSYDQLIKKVGKKFFIANPNAEIELIEVTERAISGLQKCFSLIFRGPGESYLPQNIYKLEYEGVACELFLVPVAANEKGIQYEAVFNRLL